MKVNVTRPKEQSMNIIAGTKGLTFEQALSAYADKVQADRASQEKANKPSDKPEVKQAKKSK